ncbi:MAG: MGMT family protein [Pseudomonadota bacterium]
MAKSAAFARMRAALLDLVVQIPAGRVTEIGTLAEALNMPARHAAYMLSALTEDERALLPWYRAVPKAGRFPAKAKRKPVHVQHINRLLEDGHKAGDAGDPEFTQAAYWSPPTDHANTIWADEET